MGPPRHLAALPGLTGETIEWPVPFADGVDRLLGLRGRKVAVLVSGDPFWFGAGRVLANALTPDEWVALPGPSVFSLVAARLGWALEAVQCRGLHAAPFERLVPELAPGEMFIVTLRDDPAVAALAGWLAGQGYGQSVLHVFERLGGPDARHRSASADGFDLVDVAHPVTVAFELAGRAGGFPRASGKADDLFESDGQMTKRPMRALTLSALQPRPGQRLWDIGAGTGSIAVEWLLSAPRTEAVAIELRADRAGRIARNAKRFGQDQLRVIEGDAPACLADLPLPDAVFVGGGLTAELLTWLEAHLPAGTLLVVNAVTLETEALVVAAQARLGGSLLKVELSQSQALGKFRGWASSFPVVQWSVTL